MLEKIFPNQFDNNYTGRKLALVIFTPIILFKTIMGFNIGGLNPFISAKHILESIDNVPLSSFPIDAANNILFSSMAWGMMLLSVCLISIVALFRYRNMIPMLYLVLLFEQFGRKWISFQLYQKPIIDFSSLSTAAIINWTMTLLLIIGFFLSIIGTKRRKRPINPK